MDDKKVEQWSKKIYDQTKGTSYAGAADASQGYLQSKGYSAAQIAIARSTPNISNIDAVNEQLDIYAKKFAAQAKYTELATNAANTAPNATSSGTTRTIKIEAPNSTTATVTASQSQADTLEEIFSTLGRHKKSS